MKKMLLPNYFNVGDTLNKPYLRNGGVFL